MDFSYLYSTRPRKNVDEDMADIVATFRDLLKVKKTAVKLVNYYQGLPLCYPATIVGVDHGMLDLDIHPQQAVAIERGHYTFIKCDGFPHMIGAHVQYINVHKRAVTLMKFFFAEIMAEHRHAIRLMLTPPTNAAFEAPKGPVKGQLYDLSVNGAGILVDHPCEMPEGTELKLQLMVPNIVQNTHVIATTSASFVGTSERDGAYLVRLAISPDKAVEQHISQYLFQRQVEIIRDLKEASV
ncbi:MAG: hypothetical protein A2076_07245 [Geobacteraceae bacterium GWC2_53_11]|nr:MAG: hypothetical protein A2076_07245 [Geobacteraceae bacterium GWC2_53_11]